VFSLQNKLKGLKSVIKLYLLRLDVEPITNNKSNFYGLKKSVAITASNSTIATHRAKYQGD
jgi:hypothetical protein